MAVQQQLTSPVLPRLSHRAHRRWSIPVTTLVVQL